MPSGGVTTVTAILNNMAMDFGVSAENVSVDGSLAARPVFEALAPTAWEDASAALAVEVRTRAISAGLSDVLLIRTDLPEVEGLARVTYHAKPREVMTNDVSETLLVVDLWRVANPVVSQAKGSRVAQDALGAPTKLAEAIGRSSRRSLREPIG